MGRMVLVSALAIVLLASVCMARTWHITPDGFGDLPTIQAAVDSAAEGDTLLLADGTYRGPGNRDVTVDKRLIIRSESDDPEACIIDCEGSSASPHRAFYIPFGTGLHSELSGVSVVNGWDPSWGGAVHLHGPGADIRNCIFRYNYADMGGAVWVEDYRGGPSLISECAFIGNSAGSGSAVFANYWPTHVIIEHSLFARNSAISGTIVIMAERFPEIVVEINNCTMVDNSGRYSAVRNMTFDPYSCVIRNSIIAYGTGEYQPVNDCRVQCSAFYENQPYPDWLPAGDGNFSADPLFCDTLSGDFHLDCRSPCAPAQQPECGLIGAWDVGCGPSQTEPTSWGRIKSMYR